MPFDNPSTSKTPEIALGRLLRCMTAAEREQVLLAVLRILSRRDCDERVEASPNLDDWIMSAWPSDWPGRHLVELDNVGDPGAWLSNLGGEPISQMLFGWAWDDETNARSLAHEYLREIRRQAIPCHLTSGIPLAPMDGRTKTNNKPALNLWRSCATGASAYCRDWKISLLEENKTIDFPSSRPRRIALANPSSKTSLSVDSKPWATRCCTGRTSP